MRPSSIALGLIVLASCNKKPDAAKQAAPPAPAPQVKRPVDTTPLPPLAADPGGATGKAIWASGFGGLGIDAPRGIAVGATGEVYVCGYFEGEIAFGQTGRHAAAGEAKKSDAYVAKLGPDGSLAWGRAFGDGRDDTANACAVRGDTVVVAGNFLDQLALGELTHKASGSDDLFVAAFGADGQPRWLWTAGGIDSDGANAIAATPDGGWVVGGSFSDTATFGTASLKSHGGQDAMLIKLASSGELEWVKQFGGTHNDAIRHLAVDPQGNVYVQGTFRDVSDWGGKPLTAGGAATDLVLAKYDLNGDHVWSARYGNAFEEGASGVVVDRAGNLTMVGSFDRAISFGEGDDHQSLGEADIFVARFTNAGVLQWARTWGADRVDAAAAVGVDSAGNTITTGWFEGTIDFGGGPRASKGNKDVFAIKLDPKGALVWAQTWGDKDHDQGRVITVDDAGAAYVGGLYRFTLDLGPTPLESTRADGDRVPKPDTFVVKLAR